MTIIPASQLSRADMRRLGNNLVQTIRRDRRQSIHSNSQHSQRHQPIQPQPARGAQ